MGTIANAITRLRRWRENPCIMAKEEFGVTLDPWQEEVLKAFPSQDVDKQRLAMKAAVGPGKTHVLAIMALNFLACYGEHGEHPKGAALAVTQDNLRDNLWPEISKLMNRSPFFKRVFVWTKERIFAKDHPETWFLAARSWSKKANSDEQGRTLSGLHAKYVLFLIDEAGDIPVPILRSAEQAMAVGAWNKIVIAGNPSSLEGMLYHATVRQRHLWHVINITGDPSNPKAWVHSPRVGPGPAAWATEQIALFGRDNPWVMSSILGEFPPSSINVLIGPDDIEAAFMRHLKLEAYDYAQKRLGVDVARFGDDRCHDDQTELLTNEGWKFFPQLRGDERVLTLNGDNSEWGPISAIHKYAFDGELNVNETRTANFAVTDNHRFFVRSNQRSDRYVFKPYRDLPRWYRIRAWNNWSGAGEVSVEFVTEKKMPNGGIARYPLRFNAVDWASFLGWFISEGNVYVEKRRSGRNRIIFSQNPGPKRTEIEQLLTRMGIRWRTCAGHGKQIEFTHQALGAYLMRECGVGAHNKRVPRDIKDGSQRVIITFLESFLAGDGTKRRDGNGRTYVTSSRQLADDLQEMLAKIGRAGGLSCKNRAGTVFEIDGRKSVRLHDTYVVYERSDKNRGPLMRDKFMDKAKAKRVPYHGTVWCIATPHETFLVRRKGVPMWSGNTILFPRQGLQAHLPVEMRNSRGPDVAARIALAKERWGHELAFIDDTGGFGGSVCDACVLAHIDHLPINFSGKAADPRYFNRRAEMHFRAAEWVKKGGSLPKKASLLREATAATYTLKDGRLLIEPKEMIKQRLGYSPDEWDAFCLTFSLPDAISATAPAAAILDRREQRMQSDWDPLAGEISED